MRCTRCDRPAIPQALGRDPAGQLVFGWCLDCLRAAGCTEIELRSIRKPRDFSGWMARGMRERPASKATLELDESPESPIIPGRPEAHQLFDRRRYALWVAGLLCLWGLVFLGVALGSLAWPIDPSEAGNVARRSIFLGIAGASLVMVAGFLAIGALQASGRIEPIRKVARIATPITVALILLFGILYHSPKRDPWLVILAFLVLLLGGLTGRSATSSVVEPSWRKG